ncbi:MarR family winged helix-turn-helix transcriptional regulator [Kordiimonas lacus]|uniref:DNA-binding transcriptional regulator, MarR family n=1 Tax=Kordiimonas lacus TaxID=637679 RepID=A0A1G7EFP5_9PROT|nr:MarR family transcriptional regulator [Kordiimonas lacus]SDE62427.1 DNA-binding transcriptional regulator, MarR family [Kordiimonas lacus]
MANHPSISTVEQDALRTWLKLLGTSNLVRKTLQSRLSAGYGVSLSRFDVLANLYRAPETGVRLSDLSKQLMVSNGNVTQVMTPLIKEGYVERTPCAQDARAATARLTKEGRTLFEKMATDHASWVGEIFANLSPDDHKQVANLLDKLVQTKLNQD